MRGRQSGWHVNLIAVALSPAYRQKTIYRMKANYRSLDTLFDVSVNEIIHL